MTEILIPIGTLILGLLLGWASNRQKNDPYTDMKDLTNQFANLSAQLINQINSNHSQPTTFPTPPPPYIDDEIPQGVDESVFNDMLGGAT